MPVKSEKDPVAEYVMVPREPTEAMMTAGDNRAAKMTNGLIFVEAIYRAMIAHSLPAPDLSKRVAELEEQLRLAREANRKLHRRSQHAERLHSLVKERLEWWSQYNKGRDASGLRERRSAGTYLRYAIAELNRLVTRAELRDEARSALQQGEG